ncbi:MAG: YidB family protein [Hyphomonadaceae bacterium]
MDFMNLAKGMLADKIGGDSGAIGGVMDSLLGSGDKADLGSLMSSFKDKGLGDVADSWLGDGENAAVSPDQLKDVLGADKIAQAAAQLGTDEGSLLSGLKDALPQLIDQASSGGSLMSSLGGVAGVAGMAKKLF